jgi:hypothetical protein
MTPCVFIINVVLSDPDRPSGSIYALTCTPSGNVIVSGSPDRFVRLWDPRVKTGKSQIHQLRGHSDAVRDLLVSDDGKWILSASSDTTIKLWSTSMPTTPYSSYNYSENSVWCLATNSPTLSTFWAGAKDGWVYKINNKFIDDDEFPDAIAICKESLPVLRIAVVEDEYIWTATTSSTINRWRDCPISEDRNIIVPDSCFCHPDDISEDEIESIRSKVTSITSAIDVKTKSEPILGSELVSGVQNEVTPLWERPEYSIPGLPGIKKSLLLNNKRHVITQDTEENVSIWDIICCKKIKELGKVDFDDACNTENTAVWLANWCTIDTKNGDLTIHLEEGKCYDCEMYYQDLKLSKEPSNEDQRVNLAKWMLTYLMYDHLQSLYPNNPSFMVDAAVKPPSKLEPLKLDGLRQYSSFDTPSMNVSVASPLSTPEHMGNEISSNTPFSAVVEMSPLSPSPIPMSPQASQESQDDANSTKPLKATRNPSFIDKFKFRRTRTQSGKSHDEVSISTPTRNGSFTAEKVCLSNKPPEAEEFINFDETPLIRLPDLLPICFSVEQSPSMYIDTYHGTIKNLGKLKNSDPIPLWVQDWIIQVFSSNVAYTTS